ncbi:signal peptidase II [Endothiovibrio diazotrophicus]
MVWLLLSLAVVALDQASKHWALNALVLHQPRPVVPHFDLTLVFNQGAAFSFLSDAGGWQRWLFVGLAVLVSVVLMVWVLRLGARQRWIGSALGLVLGGAVGNLIDRIRFGHVVDFLDFHYQSYHWPAFNLADSAITVGAVMLLIDAFFLAGRSSS